ncbi:fibronectin type III domain-containing protein [Chitinophaga vietnamensis]|uniref:hypothetical protein n=1 Tax=Chitinophaga vietnamensis TaxID=2593957 RepID=UPI0011779467|nr:hypothetical protein [Chitinophaga vietnamensis]
MKRYLFLSLMILGVACGKKDDPLPPGKATLIFPAQNAACTNGVVISNTQSAIVFSWNASSNTDSYELHIKNLLTRDSISQTITTNRDSVVLLRNTPYSWYVVAKSGKTSAFTASDTWKFYNAGPGTTSYAPFPAAITAPSFGQSLTATGGQISLTWTGSAVDKNITGYDVYFDTNATPALYKSNVTDMFLNNVPVTSNTTYYWKVVTHDANGNTSDSGTFQFKVN